MKPLILILAFLTMYADLSPEDREELDDELFRKIDLTEKERHAMLVFLNALDGYHGNY